MVFNKFIARDLLAVNECVCVRAHTLALVQMWLAPTTPHALSCPLPCHPPPVSAGNSKSSLYHGDREPVHWLLENPGLLLWRSPYPATFPSRRDFRQTVSRDSAPPTPPLLPRPQVRHPAGICLDRLRLGVVDGVMAVGSGCHPTSHTPSSKP